MPTIVFKDGTVVELDTVRLSPANGNRVPWPDDIESIDYPEWGERFDSKGCMNGCQMPPYRRDCNVMKMIEHARAQKEKQ